MSQTPSPWGDKSRVTSLRENLGKPFEYAPIYADDRSQDSHGSDIGDRELSTSKPYSTARSPSGNVKNNQQYRKWRIFYGAELKNIHLITMSGLKDMSPLKKGSIEEKISAEDFYFYIYKHTSILSRKV